MLPTIEARLAAELGVHSRQVQAAVGLLDGGATVPFIARYRKEATEGLDDAQLRALQERLAYLRELEERREAILRSVTEQGKLTPELERALRLATAKQELEDLYLPYKPKRRTKAQIAREAGLAALAEALLADPRRVPEAEAARYLREPFTNEHGDANPGVPDAKAALEGARQVLMENFAEDAALLAQLREQLQSQGIVTATLVEGKEAEGAKFRDYFDYREKLADVPSHRALALLRGRGEEVLRLALKLPEELLEGADPQAIHPCEARIAAHFGIAERGRPADTWLMQGARWTWQVKLGWQLEGELLTQLRERSEQEAIRVFARNLHDLLLAAPAGRRVTMGLDPGIRTGVKVAVVDSTGKVLETTTVFPHAPRNDWGGALHQLALLVVRHQVELIAIGNGTASRETDKLAGELMAKLTDRKLARVVVSESGASVYSASELASRELPELDVSLRGAVSIARRLQDPLAELVKIDPKSIGVGQYQHDVNQARLARSLDGVVEDCVNAVGVDVNTASPALLARVAGLSASLAANIVEYRNQHGAFGDRRALLKVPRLGERTFEQAAGFLRVPGGANPLDASAVHPEAYPVVERMLADLGRPVREVMGSAASLRGIDAARYTDAKFGLPTVRDILRELEKPGRDPRPEFRTAAFRDGVETLADLQPGMLLEGVITNVTNFGAFVDIGVHQDGLVHISMLANRFVTDPHEVVKAGDVVKVKVLQVDVERKRIALTMRLDDAAAAVRGGREPQRGGAGQGSGQDAGNARAGAGRGPKRGEAREARSARPAEPAGNGLMADALRAALGRK